MSGSLCAFFCVMKGLCTSQTRRGRPRKAASDSTEPAQQGEPDAKRAKGGRTLSDYEQKREQNIAYGRLCFWPLPSPCDTNAVRPGRTSGC